MRSPGVFSEELLEKILRGVSAQTYADTVLNAAHAVGVSPTAISQRLASQQQLRITVYHFPPWTSMWNKIEHHLFSYISINWRGHPLTDYRTVMNWIASTTTQIGLTVKVWLDKRSYQRGIKFSPDELEKITLRPHPFHGSGTIRSGHH